MGYDAFNKSYVFETVTSIGCLTLLTRNANLTLFLLLCGIKIALTKAYIQVDGHFIDKVVHIYLPQDTNVNGFS